MRLPGGDTAVYNSSGLDYYRHSDWLGSARLASTASRAVYYDGAYAAYGENYAETGTQDRNFTGQDQDIVPSGAYPLYDFLMREYHPTWGRWLSPDPAGLAAASPGNPQSWNRYAYVNNNPTNLVDPLGLDSWAPKLCERTANCDMTIFSGSYDLFLGGYYGEFQLMDIPVYDAAYSWVWNDDPGFWDLRQLPAGNALGLLMSGLFPGDGGGLQEAMQNAVSATLKALLSDPDCIAALMVPSNAPSEPGVPGDPVLVLSTLGVQAEDLGATGPAAKTTQDFTLSFQTAASTVVNTSGVFFGGHGSFTVGGQTLASGGPRAQGLILLHEVGHVTGVLPPDLNNTRLSEKNSSTVNADCPKALGSLSNQPGG